MAPKWDIADLHEDLKWDAGLGVRLMVMKSIVRLDTAVSDETWGVWAMIGQPF